MEEKTKGILLGTAMVVLLVSAMAGCIDTNDEQIKQNDVNVNKDKIVVITKTDCPECRDMLKPYLDKAKNEYGTEIKEYQVASPFDPAVNQILAENRLEPPTGRGMPIVCINENCYLRMEPIKAELSKFMGQ